MKQAIDELKAIPGVVGACLFSQQEGLLQSNLPGIFKADKLGAVGKQLAKLVTAGRMSFSDLNDLALHYDESVLIARELRKGLIVFAVCDPSFNQNLLTMSLNLLQEELREQPESAMASEGGKAATPAAPVAASGEISAELEPAMEGLRAALTKVLGPMAGIIFEECQQQWASQGGSLERLPALVTLLNQEIGDSEKIATFESLVAQVSHPRSS